MSRVDKEESKNKKEKVPIKHKIRTFIFTLLVLFIIIGGGFTFYALKSNTFKITSIEVSGNVNVDREKIIKDSNIKLGSNLIFQLFFNNRDSVIKGDERIKNVVFERVFPHNLVIQVTEREPQAVALRAPYFYFLDSGGRVVEKSNNIGNSNAIIINSKNLPQNVQVGQRVVDSDFRKILNVIKAIPSNQQFKFKEAGIVNDKVVLYPDSEFYIIVGDEVNIQKKIALATELLSSEKISKAGLEYMDVSDTSKPIIKERS